MGKFPVGDAIDFGKVTEMANVKHKQFYEITVHTIGGGEFLVGDGSDPESTSSQTIAMGYNAFQQFLNHETVFVHANFEHDPDAYIPYHAIDYVEVAIERDSVTYDDKNCVEGNPK